MGLSDYLFKPGPGIDPDVPEYAIVFALFLIYTIVHIFIYQMMITYELKLKDIIKNSIILSMSKLPMCALLLGATIVLCLVIYGTIGFWSIPVYATIGMSITRFPLEFYATRVIRQNIDKSNNLSKSYKKQKYF